MDLVTGGAGFIGSHLVDRLVLEGRRIRVVDAFLARPNDPATRLHYNAKRWKAHVDLVQADIRDAKAMEAAMDGVTRVFHLAAVPGVRESHIDPDRYVDINIRGTQTLLSAMEKKRTKRMILVSSSAVYGRTQGAPSKESAMLRPISVYGATKVSAESLCMAWQQTVRGSLVMVRPFSVYGPRQRPDMAIVRFLWCIMHGLPLSVFGDGSTTRDYTYVTDVVELLFRSGNKKATRYPRIYNAGGGRPARLIDVIEMLGTIVGKPPNVQLMPQPPADVDHTHADIRRAAKGLKWEPRIQLEDGLRRTWLWLSRHHKELDPAATLPG